MVASLLLLLATAQCDASGRGRNALRLSDGFAPSLLSDRAGIEIGAIEKTLSSCEEDGLLFRDIHCIKPTEKGLRFLNEMLIRFLPE